MECQKYITLLEKNHNLILTGAPGTGKTYLAKKIAKAMGCSDNEIGFVQFHPSYDYSDFVEGLRPMQDDNGSVGFERKDGVFKTFCAKALEKFDTNTFDDSFDKLLMSIGEGYKKDLYTPSGKKFSITPNSKGNLKLITGSDSKENGVLTKERIKAEFLGTPIDKWWKGYYCGVVNCLKEEFNLKTVSINTNRPFVFIIDEINRGEISKIFGELFFSIDPGYRGKDGMVETQYQNMIEDGDTFKKGFFVPKNVYIIGTMNDIDRSVESMDFAMRRRFAWKEVTAEDSMQMLDGLDNADEMKARMVKINDEILRSPGLGKAYQIGAAYFKKYELYNDFDLLWEYHLEGLLFEYLRGTTDIDKTMKKLADAYGYTKSNKYEPTSNN
ncbi:MAG: AAA family ATPase [Bacteroidales bacterium]|nr:AAA family ATPase [Bacteroidales bacterium]